MPSAYETVSTVPPIALEAAMHFPGACHITNMTSSRRENHNSRGELAQISKERARMATDHGKGP